LEKGLFATSSVAVFETAITGKPTINVGLYDKIVIEKKQKLKKKQWRIIMEANEAAHSEPAAVQGARGGD